MIPAASVLFALAGWFSLRKSVQSFQLNLLGFTIFFLIIGVFGVAGILYEKWIRWGIPLMIRMAILGFLLLIPTVTPVLKGS